MRKFWVLFAGIIFVINGCGKSESVKPQAALEREALTITEADMILAEAADSGAVSTAGVVDASGIAGVSAADAPTGMAASGAPPDKKAVQEALKALGLYGGAIDGKIGRRSEAAIMEFQRAHDLVVDGRVGPKTWAAITAALAQKVTSSQVPQAQEES